MQFSFAVLLFPKMKTSRDKKEEEEEEKVASNWQRILVAEWRIPARELRLPLIKPLECSTRRCKLSQGSTKKRTRLRGEEDEDEGDSDFVFDDVCSSLLAHVLCAPSVCFALNKRIQFVNLYRIKHETLPPTPPSLLLLLRH